METTKYGYSIGDVVYAKFDLTDETGASVPAGTACRIVAIAPKVRMMKHLARTLPYNDSKNYFLNVVRADTAEDYPRIRENFCCFQKRQFTPPVKREVSGMLALRQCNHTGKFLLGTLPNLQGDSSEFAHIPDATFLTIKDAQTHAVAHYGRLARLIE